MPDQWAKSHSQLIAAINLANGEFEATGEPNRFRYQPMAVPREIRRHAQGTLYHWGSLKAPLSETMIAVEVTGELVFHWTMDGKILEPITASLDDDDAWGDILAAIYKRDERLDER
ncbi:MAG: hypothetical protein WAN86_27080 [Hyphomicrobiaceae bacterium]